LSRAGNQAPEGSPLRKDLREIREVAQTALDNVRGLSQTLHPSILEELGLESTIDWYLSTVEKQLGIQVSYERSGVSASIDATIGIHVYRVLQEALSNVARHSGSDRASVRLRVNPGTLELEIEDHGKGLLPNVGRQGLGLVAMRERAEIVKGTLDIVPPPAGGTLIRLTVPLTSADADASALRPDLASRIS
jgi:two-component system sensor histidine kinase UhpB